MKINEYKNITFKEWSIKKFGNDDSILGDITRDFLRDKNFPNTQNIKKINDYLESIHCICDNALKAWKLLIYIYKEYYTVNK